MQIEKAVKCQIIPEIDNPCPDISYQWTAEKGAKLVVVMYFSRFLGGHEHDVELTFSNPMALQWEDESFGLISLPDELPRCTKDNYWMYPILIIENSKWADTYASRLYAAEDPKAKNVTHYALISMNDLVHVLSENAPSVRLVEPENT